MAVDRKTDSVPQVTRRGLFKYSALIGGILGVVGPVWDLAKATDGVLDTVNKTHPPLVTSKAAISLEEYRDRLAVNPSRTPSQDQDLTSTNTLINHNNENQQIRAKAITHEWQESDNAKVLGIVERGSLRLNIFEAGIVAIGTSLVMEYGPAIYRRLRRQG